MVQQCDTGQSLQQVHPGNDELAYLRFYGMLMALEEPYEHLNVKVRALTHNILDRGDHGNT